MSANEDYMPQPSDHCVTKEQRIAAHIVAMREAVEAAPDPHKLDPKRCRLCGATENIHQFRGSTTAWICNNTHINSIIETTTNTNQ